MRERETEAIPQVAVERGHGSHKCKFLSVSDRKNFTAEQIFHFT